jgi:hypothetical protein
MEVTDHSRGHLLHAPRPFSQATQRTAEFGHVTQGESAEIDHARRSPERA